MKLDDKKWLYNFRALPKHFEGNSEKAITSLQQRFSSLVNAWDDVVNSEWLCRNYFAAKLIMVATLKINAMHYSQSRNLRIVTPYLRYYSLLSLMRALSMTIPEQRWKDGELIKMTHTKAIKVTADYVKHFDKDYAEKLIRLANKLKSSRELISYHAPSSGDTNVLQDDGFEEVCTILCELAQLNSEILEQAICKRKFKERFMFNIHDMLHVTSLVYDEEILYSDDEDTYRIARIVRAYPSPVNLMLMMTEGHVDDFFGAWCEDDEKEENFNPDVDKYVIFDIP